MKTELSIADVRALLDDMLHLDNHGWIGEGNEIVQELVRYLDGDDPNVPAGWKKGIKQHCRSKDCPWRVKQPKELPAQSNGYRVVAECIHCHDHLTLWNDYRDRPRLVHVANLEPKCPIWFYAEADRPVPELGLLDESQNR